MISISTGDSRPIFRQIVDELHIKIANGTLRPGTKLPSVRALAEQLTVNPNTVAKAYSELTAMGVVETRARLGLFVCERRQIYSKKEQQRRLNEAVQQFVGEVISLDYSTSEIIERLRTELETFEMRRSA